MKAKEKAKELVDKYLQIEDSEFKNGANLMFEIEAKQCALIAVDELIVNSFPGVIKSHWEQVKQEIEQL